MSGEEPRPSTSDLIIEEIRRREEEKLQREEEQRREQPTIPIYEDPEDGKQPNPKEDPDKDRGVTEIHFFDKGKGGN